MGFVLVGCEGLGEDVGASLGDEDAHRGWDGAGHSSGSWKESWKTGSHTLTAWPGLRCVLSPCYLMNCVAQM